MVETATKERRTATPGRDLSISEPTPRIERLRNAFLDLKPSVSIDRARIETRVLKETEGEPVRTVTETSAGTISTYDFPDDETQTNDTKNHQSTAIQISSHGYPFFFVPFRIVRG